MLCCVSCLPSPTHPSIKEAAFGCLHNSGAGAEADAAKPA